jgi:RNA polymerase sigma-70 factor (ECF subfamily)
MLPDAERDPPIDASERRVRIEEALGGLPAEQAEIVRAAYFEDKCLSTMAAEKNLPLGTVKSRHRLALGRLREVITTRERDR